MASTLLHSTRCPLYQWQEKLAVAANALYRVVSAGLKICPTNGCSFLPNFPNFLFSTMSSVLSRTSSLFSLDMGIFKRCQIGCSCFADDGFCMFLICFTGYPDSVVPTELSIQYFHLFRHSRFISKYCSVDVQLRLQRIQTRSTGSPDKTKSSPCTRHFKLLWDDRTKRVEPYQLRNRVWPSFLELSFANCERQPWSHTCSCAALHTCWCLRLSSSPPHTAPRICRVALVRRRRLKRRRTPSMLSFWDHSWCAKSVPTVTPIGGVAANHSSLSDPLNCLATRLLRCLVPQSMSTHTAFRGTLPVLSQH